MKDIEDRQANASLNSEKITEDYHEKYSKKTLWGITAPVSAFMWGSVFVSILSAIFLVAGLVFLSLWLGSFIQFGEVKLFNYQISIGVFALVFITMAISAFVLKFLSFLISHLGAFKLETILRKDLSNQIARLPLGYVTGKGSGELKKVIIDDVRTLHAFVADSVPIFAKAYFLPLLALAILFWFDYRLALTTLVVLIAGFGSMSLAMKDQGELRERYERGQGLINKALIEFVQAMPIVRTFDDGRTSFKKYDESLSEHLNATKEWVYSSRMPALISMLILSPLPTIIANVAVGGILLYFGKIALANFIVVLFLSNLVADTLMTIMWLYNFIRKANAASLKIHSVFAEEPLESPQNPQMPKNANITFENVSFAYKEREVLKNISFTANEKQVVALVGPSGAGKTTLAKLLPRFWDVQNGSIKIGDVDIKNIKTHDLMNQVSFVFQENFLFRDSILNNILIANDKKTKADAIEAAKAAQIHELIESLADGYDTQVSDRGISLSGGERQRLTIARAILRDSPIIVLDEATAFADTENEEKIIKALSNLVKNKTVIIIAHKLSTIQNSDLILVLDRGEIVERGKHQELIDKNGLYKQLWDNYQEASDWNLETQDKPSQANKKATGALAKNSFENSTIQNAQTSNKDLNTDENKE